jgi:hypothetical protein
MRLIEKKVRMNPDTFAPEMLVTIGLDMLDMELAEVMQDPNTVKSDTDWGYEFRKLIECKVDE